MDDENHANVDVEDGGYGVAEGGDDGGGERDDDGGDESDFDGGVKDMMMVMVKVRLVTMTSSGRP